MPGGKIRERIDIVEIGTPFMIEYGMRAARTFKERFPDLELLCDGKIMDAGRYEAELLLRAGADYVTVLAVTDDRTVAEVVAAARDYGKKVVADLICIADLQKRRGGSGFYQSPDASGTLGQQCAGDFFPAQSAGRFQRHADLE